MSKGSTEELNSESSTASVFENIEALRVDVESVNSSMVEVLTHVAVRKPKRHEWFRVHPDDQMSLTTSVYIDKGEGRSDDCYLVAPDMREALASEYTITTLSLAVNRQGVPFLWPVPHPDGTGRANPWGETAREAAARAKEEWVRMSADMQMGGYRLWRALGDLPGPVWPVDGFDALLKRAFRGRVIEDAAHPVIRRLRGLE